MSSSTWKHIGLHGHSVGSFGVDSNGILWKSAMTASEDVSTSRSIPAKAILGAQWSVFGRSGHLRLETTGESSLQHELRFDGFPPTDYDKLKNAFEECFEVTLQKKTMSSAGASYASVKVEKKNLAFKQCILEDANEEGEEFEPRDGPEIMSIDLTEVSQCVLPGNNRNEIELQFPESDTVEAGTDQLVGLRFYVPPDPDADSSDLTPAELLQQRIMKSANIRKTTGDVIVQFDETQGTFLTPRGRYSVELYDSYFRMRGNKYDYKIKYDDISRLFLLPKADEVHQAFVISLDKPIRQGQQRYQHLVLQTTKEQSEVTVNLDEDTLKKEYNGDLQPVMHGSLSNLIAKTFKVIAHKKVFIPGKFANANQQACVKCALRANEGHLYPLEKQFIFIHKPPVLIRFDEVESVEFQRYAGGQGSTRNFDLCVTLKSGAPTKEYTFSGIDRSDYTGLFNFLSTKKIRIKNFQGVGAEDARQEAPVYNEDQIYGEAAGGEEGDEEEEDEDYDEAQANKDEEEESESDSDMDSDSLGSISEGSDIAEARKAATKKRKSSSGGGGDDDSRPKKKKKQKAAAAAAAPSSKKKKAKKKKDPNAPKRGTTAYIYFANARRPEIKAKNPDIAFSELNKQIGAEYKALSAEERKPWDEKAAEDKARYQREMANYSAPESSDHDGDSDDDKPKKKKKAKKDPNAPKKAQSAYNYYVSQNRARLKEANPDASFGDLAKLLGAEYKGLTSEQKEKYTALANADKERYKKEMESYVPPEGKSKKDSKKKAKPEKKKAAAKEESEEEDSDDDSDIVVEDSSDDSDDDSDED